MDFSLIVPDAPAWESELAAGAGEPVAVVGEPVTLQLELARTAPAKRVAIVVFRRLGAIAYPPSGGQRTIGYHISC